MGAGGLDAWDLLILLVAGVSLVLATLRLVVLLCVPGLRAHRLFALRPGYAIGDGVAVSLLWMAWSIGLLMNGWIERSAGFLLLAVAAMGGVLAIDLRSRRKACAG